MDYTTSPLTFRMRKALRYVRLYGVARTVAKIRGQYHLRRRFDPLPAPEGSPPPGGHVGIIGCGGFAFATIAYELRRIERGALRATMDVDPHRAASLAGAYGARYHTDDAQRLLDDPEIDLIFVASNHASHADYAARALAAGKAVHVEKPHCVDAAQLRLLTEAMERTGRPVNLGFNRPGSPLGRILADELARQDGPMMMNWFIAGHRIDPTHWYFDDAEGGRILGNLCHWTDFVLRLVPEDRRYPLEIHPTRSADDQSNVAVTFVFADGSIAALTFSAKGHTFEGVRETFAGHRGDLLVSLADFRELRLEIGPRTVHHRLRRRDHGHRQRIRASHRLTTGESGDPISYVRATGELFLETRRAVDEMRVVTLAAPTRSR